MAKVNALQVYAVLPFEKGGWGFALPLFRHPDKPQLPLVQELDEYLMVVAGFSTFLGDTAQAITILDGPIAYIGLPQIYAFVTDDSAVHAGQLTAIEHVLRSFLGEHADRAATALQVIELIGTEEEQRVARSRMRQLIYDRSGALAAQAFYEGSVVRGEVWGALLAEAWNPHTARRILDARSRIDRTIGSDSSVSFDVSALEPEDYTNSTLARLKRTIEVDLVSVAGKTPHSDHSAQTDKVQRDRFAVILTALDVETRRVLRHLPKVSETHVRDTVFHVGVFGNWRVAVAEVGAGNIRAALIASRAIDYFDPEVALFVGVAGGIKDVAVGDAVVAIKVYGYESGKETSRGFEPRGEVYVTAYALEQRARAIRLSTEWKSRLDPEVPHSEPRIFLGAIAAGEKVVATARGPIATYLRKQYSDALAVEMEGRGFLEGIHINAPVKGGVIRGISDLLSGKVAADAGGSQMKAADVASAIAFEILATLP